MYFFLARVEAGFSLRVGDIWGEMLGPDSLIVCCAFKSASLRVAETRGGN